MEIANLVTRLTFDIQGLAQFTAAAREITSQWEQAGQITEAAAAKLTALADKADAASASYQAAAQRTEAARQEFEKFGMTAEEVTRKVAEVNRIMDEAGTKPIGFIKMREDAKAAEEALKKVGEEEAKEAKEAEKLKKTHEDLAAAFDKQKESMKGVEKQSRLSQSSLTGMINLFQSGNISASLMAQGVQSLAGKALQAASSFTSMGTAIQVGVVAAIAGFVVAAVAAVGAIAKIVSGLKDAADAAIQLGPAAIEAAEGIERFAAASGTLELAGIFRQAETEAKAFGAAVPDALAETIAELSQLLMFMNHIPDDAAQAASAISRAFLRLDVSGLAAFGVNIDALNNKLRELTEQGAGRAQKVEAIRDAIVASLDFEEIARQAEAEANTFKQIGRDWQEMIERVGTSDQMQAAIKALVTGARELMAAIEPLIPIIGAGFGGIL